MIRSIALPPPRVKERALYKRAISAPMPNGRWSNCAPARWCPMASSSSSGSRPAASRRCRCGLPAAEAALQGAAANTATIANAARLAVTGAKPLPMTGYKLDLLSGLVQDLLERLAG